MVPYSDAIVNVYLFRVKNSRNLYYSIIYINLTRLTEAYVYAVSIAMLA